MAAILSGPQCINPPLCYVSSAGDKPILESYNYEGGDKSDLHKGHKEGHHRGSNNKVKVEVIPDGSNNIVPPIHPTPASRSNNDVEEDRNNRLHPMQTAASMADVYFLGEGAPPAAYHVVATN